MDETKLIEEVKRIIATGTRGPSPSIVPKFIDALFDAENKTISASALVRQLYPKEWAKANAKGNDVKFQLRKTNSLEKVRRLINNRLFNTPYLFQMFITLFRRKFGILTQPEPIFEKRLAELEQLPKRTPKKKGKKTKKGELKQEKQIPQLREELERRWDEFQNRTTILDLLAVIEQDVSKIRFFHSHEEVPIQDQYIPVQVTLERQYTHELENSYSYSEPEDELKRAYSFRGFSDSSAQSQISWEEARTRYDKIMVLADPGMGKSTLLKMTCLQVATSEKKKLERDNCSYTPQDAIIPLLLNLDALAASDLEIIECLCEIARREYPRVSKNAMKTLRHKLEEGKCLLLLDALDEVRLDQIKSLSERLTRFSKNYKCRLICTSSIVGYPSHFFHDFVEMEIVQFTGDQTKEYIRAWFKNFKSTISNNKATAENLLEELDDKPKVADLARIPLFLSLICSLYAYGKVLLPARRVEIYQQAVDFMLNERSQARKPGPSPRFALKRVLLEKIAFNLSSKGLERLHQRDLVRAIDDIRSELPEVNDLRKTSTVNLIDELSIDDGMLTTEKAKEGFNYLFLHRTFQEYFTASYIHQVMQDDLAAGIKLAHDHFWHLEWHETISLVAGLMDDPVPLLEAVVRKEKDDIFGTMLELGGRSTAECSDISHPFICEIITRLVDFWDNHPPSDYPEMLLLYFSRMNKELWTLVSKGAMNRLRSEEPLNRYLLFLFRNEWAIDSLIGALEDPDVNLRRKVTLILKIAGDERAVGPLMKRLQDPDRWVRIAAASALEEVGDKQAVEPLVNALKDSDEGMRSVAVSALGRIGGKRAVGPLINALQDPDQDIKFIAASALGRIGGGTAVELLIKVLQDSNQEVREAAALALGIIGDKRAVEPLMRTFQNSDQTARPVIASALEILGDARTAESLINALQDPNEELRQAAASALGSLKDERPVEPLIKALQDPSEGLRCAASLALRTLNDERAVEPLIKALQDPSEGVRCAAAFALETVGDKRAVEPLIKSFQDPDEEVRRAAVSALRTIEDKRAVGPLIKALQDPDEQVRYEAASTLETMRDKRAVEPLIKALQDPNVEVRHAAASALEIIKDKRAVEPLISMLQDPNEDLKCAAASALAEIGGKRAVEPLIKRLEHASVELKRSIVRALKTVSDEKSVRALAQLSTDDDPFVHIAAMRAIEQSTYPKALEILLEQPLAIMRSRLGFSVARTLARRRMRAMGSPIKIYPENLPKSVGIPAELT